MSMKRPAVIALWIAAAAGTGRAQLVTLQGSGAASYMDLNTNFSWLSANKINFHSGSGAPTINCSQGMDAYTNTDTGDVYWCTAANTWAQIPNAADSFANPS
jgi:hypothetical protein